jgi:hypothetical protein
MADSVGKLNVTLSADSRELDSAIDRASSKLKSFADMAGKGFSSGLGTASSLFSGGPLGLIGGLAGGGIIAGLSGLAQQALAVGKQMLETTKEAARFGLSPATMQAMHMASRGHEEGLSHALRHMNQFLGEASEGGASQVGVLGRLGLTPEELEASANPFGKVADALNKLPSATERAANAAKIFGKDWLEVADMISRGSKSIEEAKVAAFEKGLVPDPELVEQMKLYSQAMREMGESWQGFKNQTAVHVGTPTAELGSDVLNAMADAPGNTIRGWKQWFTGDSGMDWREEFAAAAEARHARAVEAARASDEADAQNKAREAAETQARRAAAAALKERDALFQRADVLMAGAENPQEKFFAANSEIQKLADAGALSPKMAARLRLGAAQNLIAAAGVKEFDALRPANVAVERGTEAERSFNLEQNRMQEQQSTQKTFLEQFREANRKLGEIAEKLDRDALDLAVVSFPN